jgi:hypothetical protein
MGSFFVENAFPKRRFVALWHWICGFPHYTVWDLSNKTVWFEKQTDNLMEADGRFQFLFTCPFPFAGD